MKKRLALILASAMLVSSALCGLTSCKSGGSDDGKVDDSKGQVYYLNFKPEQDAQWQALADAYTEETGVQVDVLTAADGTYETTLASEMAKSDAPTLFQVNGPVGLANWKDYCYDLSDAALTKEVDPNYEGSAILKEDGAVYGVAYVVETYGIIVNTKLLGDAGYKVEDIKDFASLKAIAEDITSKKSTLGFSAFASAGMDKSSDWRFKTHLANLPIYYEYKADGIQSTDAIKGTYLDNYRQIWDLYINNSTCEPGLLSAKTMDDARAEFVNSEAVFYQNGTWEYDSVKVLGDENVTMIPIYIGAEGEENQGLCIGTENFWCVNKNAAQEDIDATLDFLEWVVTSDKGTTALAEDMGFFSPFKKSKEATNPFVKLGDEMAKNGKNSVAWNFASIPSEDWKNEVGSALTAYAADPSDDTWATVVSAFVDGWASEVAKTKN